ncbi:MAG: TolB family protein, partial [Thermoplasmatota archaeon]
MEGEYNRINPILHDRKFVFSENRYGNYDVFLCDIDNGTMERITINEADQFVGGFDGRYIAWEDERRDPINNTRDIYILDLETGKEEMIKKDEGGLDLRFVDQGRVFFNYRSYDVGGKKGNFYIDIESRKQIAISTNKPN